MMIRIMRYSTTGCALALAMLVSSAGIAANIYFEDFEGLTADTDLIGQDGWIEWAPGNPGHVVDATSGFSGAGVVDVAPAPIFFSRAVTQRPHGLDFAGLVNGDVVDFSVKVKHGSDYIQMAIGPASGGHFISIEAAGSFYRMETSGGGTINSVGGTREDNVWAEFALEWTVGGDAVFTVTRLSDDAVLTTLALDTALLIPDPSVGDFINIYTSPDSGITQIDDIFLSITKIPLIPEDADFDDDFDVDGNDFLLWQRGFGTGTTHAEGDADGSGGVDGADLTIWESQFGNSSLSVVAAGVPEPASCWLILCCGSLLAWNVRSRR